MLILKILKLITEVDKSKFFILLDNMHQLNEYFVYIYTGLKNYL